MYCSKADMIARFDEEELIELTTTNAMDVIDNVVLDQAISDASAEINGYLAGRYALPLANVPATLPRLACNIARYNLFDHEAPDRVNTLYKDAITFLKSVAKGDVSLGVTETGTKAQSTDLPQIESGGSVFSRQNSQGFI